MPPPRLLAFVMAGSKGYGFGPLTRERSKSDLPFAARYRIIDFPLSNLRNSGVTAICVLTQHGSNSLSDHTNDTWRVRPGPFESIAARTAKCQSGNRLYRGTADAVLQNFDLVDDFRPDAVLVLPGEHVSRINLRCMAEFHKLCGASATIACLPMPITDAVRFGIVEIDAEQRIVGFREKPGGDIRCLPTRPGHVMASTGTYVFSPEAVMNILSGTYTYFKQVGVACVADLVGRRMVWCHAESDAWGDLRISSEARRAVKELLADLSP